MGFAIIFSLLFYFLIIFIITTIISILSGIITYFVSNKNKKKIKVLTAIFTPFIIIYTFLIFSIIGTIIISETKNIDLGMGDTWCVPLNENLEILMIDSTERAFLKSEEKVLIENITQIQQINEKIYGKNSENKFFSFNLSNNKYKNYFTQEELIKQEKIIDINLIEIFEFYQNKKWEVSGIETIILQILSLIISIIIGVLFCRLSLKNRKLKLDKKTTTNTCS